MDPAYLHLVVNHLPVVLSVVGAAAAIVALLVRRRGVWLYSVASMTIAGAIVYPVMLTGHAAEHEVKKQWYVDRDAVDAHEDAADIATWTVLGAGVVAVAVWWSLARRKDGAVLELPPVWAQGLVLIAALAGSGTIAYAAYQGGKIVHDAVRLQSPPPGVAPLPPATPGPAASP